LHGKSNGFIIVRYNIEGIGIEIGIGIGDLEHKCVWWGK